MAQAPGTAGMGFPAATFEDTHFYGVAIDYVGKLNIGFFGKGFVGLKKSTDAINVEGSKVALTRCLALGLFVKHSAGRAPVLLRSKKQTAWGFPCLRR